jgi:uncharacterized membrane protein YozB (DUF420 family)
METREILPLVNACLNGLTLVFLLAGFVLIKMGRKECHKKAMTAALVTSAVFLTSYLTHKAMFGHTTYPHHDWTRPVYYFVVLIPHLTLAVLNLPLIFAAVYFAIRQDFEKHKKVVRWAWPVWIYVSVTGVLVYWMLYRM